MLTSRARLQRGPRPDPARQAVVSKQWGLQSGESKRGEIAKETGGAPRASAGLRSGKSAVANTTTIRARITDGDGDLAVLSRAGASRDRRERRGATCRIAGYAPGVERGHPSLPRPRVSSDKSSTTSAAPPVGPRRAAPGNVRRRIRGAHHEHRQRDGEALRQAGAQQRLPRGVRLHRRRRLGHPLGGLRGRRGRRGRERPGALPRGRRVRAGRRHRE